MATFKVDRSLALSGHNLFVLAGDVTSGTVAAGLSVRLGHESDSPEREIRAIEIVDYADRKEARVALCVACSSASELS